MNESLIQKILLEEGYIRSEDAEKAEKEVQEKKISFSDSLLRQKIITKDILGQALAEFFHCPYLHISSHEISPSLIKKIPEEQAHKERWVLYEKTEEKIKIVTDNPENENIKNVMEQLFPGEKYEVYFILPEDLNHVLKSYKKSLSERIQNIIEKEESVAPQIMDQILKDALESKTSDIHFEPGEEEISIRFRIDGVLEKVGSMPPLHYEKILNRLKVQAHMRMDEHFAAQDGALRIDQEDGHLDIRISIIPTIAGEKITLRLLTSYLQGLTLQDIGLSPSQEKILLRSVKKPFGMILVTGPTGSGKTTSLYSLVQILNTPQVNITTIEDPVEYKIAGTNQIKVDPQTDLTFAKGLRSIVRQDPDIILVGEIRDQETAEIAVNASLTGHLLLSSFHANDTATAVVRMLDMGIEPFLLSSTLEIVVAQRLLRMICPYTKHSVTYSIEELEKKLPQARKYFGEGPVTLYEGKPSPLNNNTGYLGRTAIFEFLPVDKELQDLILKNPSKKEIWNIAQKKEVQSLFENGIEKVKQGITTLDELLRVSSPFEKE